MQSLIRPEYIDAALEKASCPAEAADLDALKTLVIALVAAEETSLQQCIDNRIKAGENPKRTTAPPSVQAASDRAAEDIHKLELRKCRRARTAPEIVWSLLQLSQNDTDFNRPLLVCIELADNRAIAESLLVQKEALQARLGEFLSRWQSAA